MRYSTAVIATVLMARVQAHGVVTSITGANGVVMPGLSVADGTPRDCATPRCGAEADTSIIRKNELGTNKASALGRTEGGGPVDAAKAVATFMGAGAVKAAPAAVGSGAGEGTAGNITATGHVARGLLDGLKAKLGGGAAAGGKAATGQGTKTPKGTVENGVAAAAGSGATSGLPTCAADGTITMTFHQVNQDGAGPLKAAVDPTSGGTDPTAFQPAAVTQDVPGIGIGGLSRTTTTDFPIKVQMPAGMVCQGTVAGQTGVCIVRVQNSALAGPFGGSAAFVQSPTAKKRALEVRYAGKHFARGMLHSGVRNSE